MEEKLLLDIALPDHKEVREAFDSVMVKLYAQYQKNKEEEKRNVQQGTEIEVQKGFVFLVCGTDPFVGTSTTVLYLAAGLAKSGKHVLLVDADLRKDRMEKQIGRECANTLAEYLLGICTLENIIYPTILEDLDVVPGGKIVDPVPFLCSRRMHNLFKMLKKEYDIILVDVPAMGSTSDAIAVLRETNQIILVAAPYKSYKKQIIECVEIFQKYGGNLLGIVVNQVDRYGSTQYKRGAKQKKKIK